MASQIPTHLCDGFPKSVRGHLGGRLVGLRSHDGEQISIHHLASRTLRLSAGKVSQLQQTHR